ncbi:glycosyl hydrolase, partial [Helicosporidium sp. ATCC 50920]
MSVVCILACAQGRRYNTTSIRCEGRVKGSPGLNVHIVCHTHDDPGWLKTVDQYYWGSKNTIVTAGVQYILDTVLMELEANPDRTFTYAEMSFFRRWWNQQERETKDRVKKLVEDGRLVFVNGGHVQHDEATCHYQSMIDQTTLGHSFLKETFGVTPRVGWQLDPFGHSATQAALLTGEAGYEAIFFGRTDYQELAARRAQGHLEFLWRPHGEGEPVFAGAFASGNYGPPEGFGFEWGAEPIADDPAMGEFNVHERVEAFVQRAQELFASTKGRDVMLTMGSDFNFANAHLWYANLDRLIHYVNLDGRVNVLYSSPEMYADAKKNRKGDWTHRSGDLFPYADGPHAYWTGYFSSRPTSKRFIRQAG